MILQIILMIVMHICQTHLIIKFNCPSSFFKRCWVKRSLQKNVNHGYLKPKRGVNDFIDSSTNAAIRYFLDTGNYTFLYG